MNEAAGTEFDKAIQNAVTPTGADETRSLAERQGDALFDIAAFFNKNHDGSEAPGLGTSAISGILLGCCRVAEPV